MPIRTLELICRPGLARTPAREGAILMKNAQDQQRERERETGIFRKSKLKESHAQLLTPIFDALHQRMIGSVRKT